MSRLSVQIARIGRWLQRISTYRKKRNRRYLAAHIPSIPALTFRQLEPRRVLSVTSSLDAGLLTIALSDGSAASLQTDSAGTEFFVDADGNQTRDASEFHGLLKDLDSLVVTDSGNGSFTWLNTFQLRSANIQADSIQLGGSLALDNNLDLSARQEVVVSGQVHIDGNLTIDDQTQTVRNIDQAQLTVRGHTQLDAQHVDLGQQLNDQILFHSVSFNRGDSDLVIHEDASASDPNTVILNNNSAGRMTIHSAGSIEVAKDATVSALGNIELFSHAQDADLIIHGHLESRSGSITLLSDDQIDLHGSALVSTKIGAITLSANLDGLDGDNDDGITMDESTAISSSSGPIKLSNLGAFGGSIAVSHIETSSSSNQAIEILSQSSIIDSTPSDPDSPSPALLNLSAAGGTIFLQSSQNIGHSNEIDIDAANLIFSAGGNIQVTDHRGGLTISGPSSATGGGIIAAHSPLTISADITVGASTSFIAGDSAQANDHLSINSNATVRLNSNTASKLSFIAGDDILLDTGRIQTSGNARHTVELIADHDHAGSGANDGQRGRIIESSPLVVEVTTNHLTISAASFARLDTNVDSLEATLTAAGDLVINERDDILLQRLTTTNGSIMVHSLGSMSIDSVHGGGNHEVRLTAGQRMFDGDSANDDVDVEGYNIHLASTSGSIGQAPTAIFTGLALPLEVIARNNLFATAQNGDVALDPQFSGSLTVVARTAWLQSPGDLDLSNSQFSVRNLALIADADQDGLGTLTLDNQISVSGDLRIEGADVAAVAPLTLSADRLLYISGRALDNSPNDESLNIHARQFDGTTSGSLTVNWSSTAPVSLIDLNQNSIALQTLSSTGNLFVSSDTHLSVLNDCLAGNDNSSTSSGSIRFQVIDNGSDLFIDAVILSDSGDITLESDDDLVLLGGVVTTILGNITLTADTNGDASSSGGELSMASSTRVIAGRNANSNYQSGITPPSVFSLSTQAVSQGAEVRLSSAESVTLSSVQSANNTQNAIHIAVTALAILDASDADGVANLLAPFTGALVTLDGFIGIGSDNALETDVYAIAATLNPPVGQAGSNAIRIHELASGGDLRVAHASSDGDISFLVDAGQLIILPSSSFGLNQPGITTTSGNILLESSTSDVLIQADVQSSSGNISIIAHDDVLIDAQVTTTDASVVVSANNSSSGTLESDGIRMTGNSRISSSGGVIRLATQNDGNIVLGMLDTTLRDPAEGAVSLVASGSILTASGNLASVNIETGRLRMVADSDLNRTGGIGAADPFNGNPNINAHAIAISTPRVSAHSSQGIYLFQSGDLLVDDTGVIQIEQQQFSGRAISLTDAAQSDLRTAGDGVIKVVLTSGSLTLNPGSDRNALAIDAVGDVLLATRSATGDISITTGAGVRSTTGNIDIDAGNSLTLAATLNASGDIVAFARDIALETNSRIDSTGGNIYLQSSAALDHAGQITTAGSIGLRAAGELTITGTLESDQDIILDTSSNLRMGSSSRIVATDLLIVHAAGNIELGSVQADYVGLDAGANISDSNAAAENVRANQLVLRAGNQIGSSDLNSAADTNNNAIDLRLGGLNGNAPGKLSAHAVAGIYLQEISATGTLVVDAIAAQSIQLNTQRVNFNSTRQVITITSNQSASEDLVTTSGPIKLVVNNSALIVAAGSVDTFGIKSGSGDILLETRGSGHDLTIQSTVASTSGHITFRSSDDINLNGAVQTGQAGTIYVSAQNLNRDSATNDGIVVSAAITSDRGDILLSSQAHVTLGGVIRSNADSAVIAASQVNQTSNIDISGNLLIDAGQSVTMSSAARSVSTGSILIISGADIQLGLLEANQVALQAVGSILDNNDIRVSATQATNIRADSLSMRAGQAIGGPDPLATSGQFNLSAIDLEVAIVAAEANDGGIYLQQLAAGGDLTIGSVAALQIQINVVQADFRSSTSPVTESGLPIVRSLQNLSDLETLGDGAIKTRVDQGSLLLSPGNDQDLASIVAHGSGDILLLAHGSSSDIQIDTGASVRSTTGHITLIADDDLLINSTLVTQGTGTLYLVARDQTIADVRGVHIRSSISTAAGDMLIDSRGNVVLDASLTSSQGNIGVFASQHIQANSTIVTSGQLVLDAGGNVQMSANSSFTATESAIVRSGGTVTLAYVESASVSVQAAIDIVDGNDQVGLTLVNINATEVALRAGGTIGTADAGSNTPDNNALAIDLTVDMVAAQSGTGGIYLQQLASGGNLTIGHVTGQTTELVIQEVEFRSTLRPLTDGGNRLVRSLAALDDLETLGNGSIKVRVDAGQLTLTAGTDQDSAAVIATGSGDVWLRAYGTNSDLVSVQLVGISSGSGHISLMADDDVRLNATIRTAGDGSILIRSFNATRGESIDGIALDGQIASGRGDILLDARRSSAATAIAQDIQFSAALSSQTGSVGLLADRHVRLAGTMATSGDVWIDASEAITMQLSAAVVTSGTGNALLRSGGNMALGLVSASHVALSAGGSILDANDTASTVTNVRASELRATAANSIGRAGQAIETEVGSVAAASSTGIHLYELTTGGQLIVGHASAVSIDITVHQAEFRSTTRPLSAGDSLGGLDDVELSGTGNIELTVAAGRLLITDGDDQDRLGIVHRGSGDIVLRTNDFSGLAAPLNGSIVLDTGIQGRGDVTLSAFSFIDESSSSARIVGTQAGSGSLLTIRAGTYAHLHDVTVGRLDAQVGMFGHLDSPGWQRVNEIAANESTRLFERLDGRDSSGNGVLTSAVGQRGIYATLGDTVGRYDFRAKYADDYALLLVNRGDLDVQSVVAGDLLQLVIPNKPNVYIETRDGGDLNITGLIRTLSNTNVEGGIVLVASGQLAMQPGSEITTDRLDSRTLQSRVSQSVDFIAYPQFDVGQANREVLGALRAVVFNGGEGVGNELTTQNILVNALGLQHPPYIGQADPLRLVLQRVVMQFGQAAEEGFSIYVGYADGLVQEFDTQGDVGREILAPVRPVNLSAIDAAPAPNQTAVVTRAIPFAQEFLFANQDLETVAIVRRADDFFFFQGADSASTIQDLAYEFHVITGVSADGSEGATEMPPEPVPLDPELPPLVPPRELSTAAQLQINQLPELPTIVQRPFEVIVYRVSFDDSNSNGQVEQNELPSTDQVQNADEVNEDDFESRQASKQFQRTRVKQLNIGSGGIPSAQDLDRFKAEFSADPEQSSGAYAIIQKDGDQETVLEIFSLRDWPEDQPSDRPLILPEGLPAESLPIVPPLNQPQPAQSQPDQPAVNDPSPEPRADDQSYNLWDDARDAADLDALQDWTGQPTQMSGKWESRLASSGILMGTLMMLQTPPAQTSDVLEWIQDASRTGQAVDLSSAARRARKFQQFSQSHHHAK